MKNQKQTKPAITLESLTKGSVAQPKAATAVETKPAKAVKEVKVPLTREEIQAKHSAGVAKTWSDPKVKAARMHRDAVEVDGVQYGSLRKAFKALKLDDTKHIKFRGELKAAGEGTFGGYDFNVVPFISKATTTKEEKAAAKAAAAQATKDAAIKAETKAIAAKLTNKPAKGKGQQASA